MNSTVEKLKAIYEKQKRAAEEFAAMEKDAGFKVCGTPSVSMMRDGLHLYHGIDELAALPGAEVIESGEPSRPDYICKTVKVDGLVAYQLGYHDETGKVVYLGRPVTS